MLSLLARRARAQWPLVAALLAVVTLGVTLLGTCALLVTRTAQQSVESAAAQAPPGAVDVTAYTGTVRGPDAKSVVDDTRTVLTSSLTPFACTTAARASSVLRSLPAALGGTPGALAQSYLSGVQNLPTGVRLTAGRLPAAHASPMEAVVLGSTARLLGLRLGTRVHLGAELIGEPAPALDVTVVGVAEPLPGTGWDRDPLAGVGYDLAYHDGRSVQPVHVYGPFLVDLGDLLAGSSTIDRLEVTAHPDLSAPSRRDLDTVVATVPEADRHLAGTLGDRVQIERISSQLPLTLQVAYDQQQVTAATVLAVAVLGMVLTGTALALAGRLTAGVRAGETALVSAMGVSRRQLAAAAVVEAGALAVLASAIGIPASAGLHAALTRIPPLVGAGLVARPGTSGLQVLAVIVGALALAALLVGLAVRPVAAIGQRRHRRELLARSGADLLLVVFAVGGWWQLHAEPTGAGVHADAVRVLAPALMLVAGAALALRLVAPALRGVDRLARRARGLAAPLAAFEAARRPQAVAVGLLVCLGCAAGTFGIAFDATWQRAQRDQADLSVGTDLALALTAPPVAGQGADISVATGGVVSPATDRGIAVGQWLGATGDAPRLVAVDTTRAGALLRGRLDGARQWTDVGAALAPATPVTGIAVPAGAVLTLTGTATGATPLTVTPKLVLQDDTGLRTPCIGAPVPLDGHAHPLAGCVTAAGLQLVAVSLPVAADQAGPAGGIDAPFTDGDPGDDTGPSRVTAVLTVPGAHGTAAWTASSAPPMPGQLENPEVAVAATPGGLDLHLTAAVQLSGADQAARTLVATAFQAPGPVPVAVSARFASSISVHRGSPLSLTVGATAVPATVVAVLPTVPSAPGAAAVLADLDALSRVLIVADDVAPPVDAWWVGRPDRPDAVARLDGLHIGTVGARAGETARLTGGPLRAALPAALRLLIPAAVLLLLAGVVLHVTCDLQARALDVARLRGIGMTRREIRVVLFGQHAGILLPLLAAGTVVGALATRTVAPLLVLSDTGAAPVPTVLPRWPWPTEAILLCMLLAGCVLAVTVVVSVQARRADAAHLRVAS